MVTADMFLTELPLGQKYKRQTATGVICLQSSQTIWVLKGLVSRVFNKGEDFTLKPKCSVLDIFCLYVICCCLFLYIINSSSFCVLSVFFLCTEFACVWVSLSQSKHLQVQFPLRELNTWNLEFPITRTFTSLWLLTVRYQVLPRVSTVISLKRRDDYVCTAMVCLVGEALDIDFPSLLHIITFKC